MLYIYMCVYVTVRAGKSLEICSGSFVFCVCVSVGKFVLTQCSQCFTFNRSLKCLSAKPLLEVDSPFKTHKERTISVVVRFGNISFAADFGSR